MTNLSTTHIHTLLIDVISNEIEIKQAIREREEQKSKFQIQRLEEVRVKLQDFEKKHEEELLSIFPGYIHMDWGFLGMAYNDINCQIHFLKDSERCSGQYRNQVTKEEEKYFYGPPDMAVISYQDFHKETNLNHDSVKKYLNEMIEMGLIKRNRVMGGFEYGLVQGGN